eukprot:scaffold7305_cov178-Ochromonas_danica.AAC.5
MSAMWQLPKGILAIFYGEWLGLKDLSRLDVACVEKNDREPWLSSLNDLRISRGEVGVSNDKVDIFSIWLVNRKVLCVEGFPLSVNVLEDLVGGLDAVESYCPALRSIEIDTRTTSDLSKEEQLKSNLSVLLSHCHNLQGVTVRMNTNSQAKQLSDEVMQVLVEKLRENSLVKISLQDIERYNEHHVMVADILRKHALSLRDLDIVIKDGVGIDLITSILIENRIHLRALNVNSNCEHPQTMNSFMSYLSLAGELLEILNVGSGVLGSAGIDDLVATLSTSCPKLTSLVISGASTCSAENLRHLFEQCPHLQVVDIDEAILIRHDNSSVAIEVQGSNDDWAVCLSHVLRRRQVKQVTLRQRSRDHYIPVGILKSLLEPYEIHLETSSSESCLITLLRDLPHLNCLYLMPFNGKQYTDATLAAIKEHAKSLTKFDAPYNFPTFLNGSEAMLAELIESCELIESLAMYCSGLESLVAVSKHSSLSIVRLEMAESVSEEMLDGLLLDKNVRWPSTLKEGYVRSSPRNTLYYFNKESHHWTKRLYK